MIRAFPAIALAVTVNSAFGQGQDGDCGPKLEPMITTRIPDFDENGDPTNVLITVSEGETDTRKIIAYYETPYSDWVGTYTMSGDIDFTNKSNVRRTVRFRQSIRIDEGIMPIIPPMYAAEVCWEPDIRRLITYYTQELDPGESVNQTIYWQITTRLEAQLADVNADGIVDGVDQGLLMAAFGTDNPLYDLDQSGLVDSNDLGILLSQWSETSDDFIEDANAGETDPVEQMWNPAWESADYIIAANIEQEPIEENGQLKLPFLSWQWIA